MKTTLFLLANLMILCAPCLSAETDAPKLRAGAAAVMALERVPADIRAQGGVARQRLAAEQGT